MYYVSATVLSSTKLRDNFWCTDYYYPTGRDEEKTIEEWVFAWDYSDFKRWHQNESPEQVVKPKGHLFPIAWFLKLLGSNYESLYWITILGVRGVIIIYGSDCSFCVWNKLIKRYKSHRDRDL